MVGPGSRSLGPALSHVHNGAEVRHPPERRYILDGFEVMTQTPRPIDPPDAFFGGRTNAYQLFRHALGDERDVVFLSLNGLLSHLPILVSLSRQV